MSCTPSLSVLLVGLSAAASLGFGSCSDDDDSHTPFHDYTDPGSSISDVTVEANRFVSDAMSDYYYWVDEMPDLDYTKQPDTEDFFYDLLSSKDRFSYISSDADATLGNFQGQYTDFGWEFLLSFLSSNKDTVVAIISYVYDDSPAAAAGVKRGDVVFAVDGTVMTAANFRTLFSSASSGNFSAFRVEDKQLNTVSYAMTAAQITKNPVAVTNVFTQPDGSKVGYLFYTSYSYAFNSDLIAAFKNFKEEGVTDIVLDLRYNTGGDLDALSCLVDMLAPASAVEAKSEYLYYEFNKTLQSDPAYSREATGLHFSTDPGVNLDLSKLVVLVGSDTYSASEATIWALKPYLDVKLIGTTTGGKNSMMYVMSPADFTFAQTGKPYYSSSINNWLIMPIVAIYKNATGETFDTSRGYGLSPDFEVADLSELLTVGAKQIGDPEENLLSAALSYLANGTVPSNKSATTADMPDAISSSAQSRPHALVDLRKHVKSQPAAD